MSEQQAATIRRSNPARLAVVLNAGLALALALLWMQQALREGFWKGDFINYYASGVMLREGQGAHLYDRAWQQQYQARLLPERGETNAVLAFNYPPHATLPTPLFALLSRDAAFYLWDGMQLLLLIPLFHFLRRLTAAPRPLPFALLLTGVLAFPPLFISFQLGQVSLLLLVCLLGFICNLMEGRPFRTALWLTLGTIKPQMMVAPAAILLAQRRWRELGLAAIFLTIWGLATTALLGVSCWLDFTKMLQYSASQFGQDGIHPLAMYNLKGFLTSVFGDGAAAQINALSAAALLLALLVIVWQGRKPISVGTAEWDVRMAWWLQLGLLVNPHLNPVDALAFVAPALLFYRGLRRSGQPSGVAAAVLLAAPALFALDCYGLMVARPASVHVFFVVMVGLAMMMTRTISPERQRRVGAAPVAGAPG